MGAYQGRALERPRRRPAGPLRRIARILGLIAMLALFAHLPWRLLRQRFAVVSDVRVEGTHYLDASRVAAIAHLGAGQDLFDVDLARARQALLLDSRVAGARVARRLPRGIRITIEERLPVLLVSHGVPWEIDSTGVLLAPLQKGVVADVPLLVGPTLDGLPAGAQVHSGPVARGLAWMRSLSEQELQLAGEISEVDVSSATTTRLTLLSGTRVIAPAWPPPIRCLSALRVVLADLKQKGTTADEVDVRFDNQVIVRPVEGPEDTHSG